MKEINIHLKTIPHQNVFPSSNTCITTGTELPFCTSKGLYAAGNHHSMVVTLHRTGKIRMEQDVRWRS